MGCLPLLGRPCLMTGAPVLRQGRGKAREPDPRGLLFLGQIRGRLLGVLLDGGADQREFHLPDALLLDMRRTVAQMGAQVRWWLGIRGADEREFAGVPFLSWWRLRRGHPGLICSCAG